MIERTFDGRGIEKSRTLFERAARVLPGGVSSPVRAFNAVGGTPRFIARGFGPFLWDVDGNRYIDFVMSWGPLIHGHAFAPVVAAIEAVAAYGTSYGAPTEMEVSLAEMLVDAVPSLDMVRFVNSGTEATMSAIRLARAHTRRDSIVKFAGNYHGHADSLLARAGSGSLTLGVPTSPGVPSGAAASTMVASYNNTDELEHIFATRGEEIAAVIVEPVAGNMGVIPPAPGFLETIRRLTSTYGALFLCDEVITGFRVAHDGAQGYYGIDPDLTTLGKIVGGGLPVGVYGGRADIMSEIAPTGPVYQAGTLSGNPLAMSAGIANLGPLRASGFYERLHTLTRHLATGLRAAAEAAGVAVTVNEVTGMLTMFFNPGPVRSLTEAETADTQRYAAFFQAMLDRDVYLPPSQFEAWMVSAAHTPELIDHTVEMAAEALRGLQ